MYIYLYWLFDPFKKGPAASHAKLRISDLKRPSATTSLLSNGAAGMCVSHTLLGRMPRFVW